MTTSQQLASIPAADIALLGGGRLANLGCASAPSIVDIALAYPEALVDGFDDDGAAHRRGRGPRRPPSASTGRVAFRQVDPARVRVEDLPAYAVVVAPPHLRDVAVRLAGDTGVVVLDAA